MGKKLELQSKTVVGDDVYLDELRPGSDGPIMVMICRKWDVHTAKGTYMSTDFIVSDQKGNFMHCLAKHNRSYKFVHTLEEGSLYMLSGFTVHPNRNEFRILKDSPYMLEFDGSTSVKKATGDVNVFVRHVFQICSFEALVPTDKKYVVDVIGYIMYVGESIMKSNGSQTLEFMLTNESGRQIPVTLWGALGDELKKKRGPRTDPYVCIFTCMSVKKYLGELGISSTSSTQIIDSRDLPPIQTFTALLSDNNRDEMPLAAIDPLPKIDTLAELLRWGRDKKNGRVREDANVLFQNTLEIVDIRTRSGWYLITCTSGRCRKGLTRVKGGFWCEGCKSSVLYPHIRYKVQLDVKDETMSTVLVLFDEPAETLIKRTTKSLMEEEQQGDWDGDVIPPILRDLIGTKHVFEIKGHTYYQAGEYEAFNCTQVITIETVASTNIIDSTKDKPTDPSAGTPSKLPKSPAPIVTPAKTNGRKKRIL